ncbi:hypothetical protein ABZ023_30975 [Streptomyces sp. NPDC006367]|uniref:hypothetical protein n=1 Tax=unclassified Streptomyces TaxID=2593676 RepID=UPI0033AF63BC
MPHYFVTGYSADDTLTRTQVTPAPQDPAERGKRYDALLYSPQGQDDGMLAFTVEADDEDAALEEGHERHTAWRADSSPEHR